MLNLIKFYPPCKKLSIYERLCVFCIICHDLYVIKTNYCRLVRSFRAEKLDKQQNGCYPIFNIFSIHLENLTRFQIHQFIFLFWIPSLSWIKTFWRRGEDFFSWIVRHLCIWGPKRHLVWCRVKELSLEICKVYEIINLVQGQYAIRPNLPENATVKLEGLFFSTQSINVWLFYSICILKHFWCIDYFIYQQYIFYDRMNIQFNSIQFSLLTN